MTGNAAQPRITIIPTRFWTRRCHGCADTSAHDSHLTLLGRLALRLRRP